MNHDPSDCPDCARGTNGHGDDTTGDPAMIGSSVKAYVVLHFVRGMIATFDTEQEALAFIAGRSNMKVIEST